MFSMVYNLRMTNLFKWDDSLSTGFNEVDLQHKKLIMIIEDVHSAMQASPEEYALRIAKDLKRLTDYTHYHFTEEESLMRKNLFPGLDAHKKEHDAFIARVTSQIGTLSASNPDDGYQFYRFLGTWLLAHIAKSDQEWASFIKDRATR